MPSFLDLEKKTDLHETIIDIVKKNNIKIIDLKEIFENHGSDPSTYFAENGQGHFNEKGYKLIADIISNIPSN